MSTEYITMTKIEEISFVLNYLINNISKYKLSKLTNGNCGDIISINNCHPLAIEYGNLINADEKGNYTSILPAIGVELTDDSQNAQQLMGAGYQVVEINQSFIDYLSDIELKDRFKNGIIASNETIASIQTMLDNKGTDKLYAKKEKFFQKQILNISLWSDNFELTRIVYTVLRDLLQRLKHALSKVGIKNAVLNGQGSIYNYEFNITMFGTEFTLEFINTLISLEIDPSINSIKGVEEFIVNSDPLSKPLFKAIGE